MRTVNITEQNYLNYGTVNKLSYEILPFVGETSEASEPQEDTEIGGNETSEPQEDTEIGGNFPFNYILYNSDIEVVNSIDCLSQEEFNDWSVFQLMDNKICAKIGLNI